jgi:ribosomal peptide maturation radical SAM protein 1
VTDVLLVVPPFASAALPALGPSVLVAGLRRAGLDAHVLHASLDLAARVGYGRYCRFAAASWLSHGDLLFAEAAWGRPPPPEAVAFGPRRDAVNREDWAASLGALPTWIEEVADAIAATSPGVVGFSSVFEQNVASVALARAVRARLPGTPILIGGANAARPMGAAIAEATDVFDLVVGGEAERELPGLVRRLLGGWRPSERVVECAPLPSLSESPRPEFDDYFAQLRPFVAAGLLPSGLPIELPFESSRGCWWGQRSHCTFCGLLGAGIAERAHSPERVLGDIEALVELWGARQLRAVDNLLPVGMQRTVLPELARRRPGRDHPLRLFYEVRSHLKRRDLELLAAAGVLQVQAGLESMSTETLRRIGKGVTGPMNVAFLRNARATGIQVQWNWMVCVPNDEAEDYEAFLRLMPFIEHLQPPMGVVPVRIDRFSPYHADPERYGIRDVEPLPSLAGAWPDHADLRAVSYHFTAEVRSAYLDPELAARANQALGLWLAAWDAGPPTLEAEALEDGRLRVRDTRRVAVEPQTTLSKRASELLLRLDKPTPSEAQAGQPGLGALLYRGFVAQHEGMLVSVVVR